MGDIPPEPPRQTEIQRYEQQQKSQDLWNHLFDKSARPSAPQTLIEKIGPIASLLLPGTWAEVPAVENVRGRSSYREFDLADNNDVKFCFYYRGLRTSPESGAALSKVLAEPAHQLSKAEIQSLTEVLRDKGDPDNFSMAKAETEVVNRKNVLAIEGFFQDRQLNCKCIFVPSDYTGTVVQEAYYIAPEKAYHKHFEEAQKGFKSIILSP